MSILNRFFKRATKKQQTDAGSSAVHNISLNSATYANTQDLISLQQVSKGMNLYHRSFASAATSGTHRSKFRGRGMDYQESRIYQAGDDIRNMDWRVTARTGKPHTKLFQEERERPVILFVDLSSSMFFGSVKSLKSVVAAKVATIIAWSVAAKGDRIGALLINESHKELSPKMGKRGVLQLIKELVIHLDPIKGLQATTNPNSLNEELQRLRHLARPGSLVFLISDFYGIDSNTEKYLQRLSRHIDIQAIQIVDPLEEAPPQSGQYTITDGNQHTGVLNTQSKKGKETYQSFCSQHHANIQKMMLRYNIPLIKISTSDDILLILKQSFGQHRPKSMIVKKDEVNA